MVFAANSEVFKSLNFKALSVFALPLRRASSRVRELLQLLQGGGEEGEPDQAPEVLEREKSLDSTAW